MPQPRPLPDPDTIRETAHKVLSNLEYTIGPAEDSPPIDLWEWLRPLREWWPEWLDFSGAGQGSTPDGGPGVWFEALSIALLVLLVIAVIVAAVRALRTRERTRRRRTPPNVPGTSSPEHWEALAHTAADTGDLADAVRLLLKAAILRIEQFHQRIHRPGTTNREILHRYQRAAIAESLKALVDTVDRTWYGDHTCTHQEFDEALRHSSTIERMLRMSRRPGPAENAAGNPAAATPTRNRIHVR